MVSWFSASTPFWFAAMLAAANTTQVLLQFDETNKHIRHVPVQFSKGMANIVRAYAMPELRTIFLTSFFFNAGFGFFISFFGLFLIHRFNFNEARIGNFFAWVGVCAIFTQIVTTRTGGGEFLRAQVLKVSLFGVAAVMFAYLLAPSPLWLFLIAPDQLDVQRPVAGEHGRPAEPIGRAAGAGRNSRHRLEHRALANSLPPLIGGFVAASFAPEAPVLAAGADDVPGVGDLYRDIPPDACPGKSGVNRVATWRPGPVPPAFRAPRGRPRRPWACHRPA